MNLAHKVETTILAIVGVIVIFLLVGNTASSMTDAADNLSGSGLPLASLFSSNGVVLMIFMVGIIVAVIAMVLGKKQ